MNACFHITVVRYWRFSGDGVFISFHFAVCHVSLHLNDNEGDDDNEQRQPQRLVNALRVYTTVFCGMLV